MLLPRHCPICRSLGEAPCGACLRQLEHAPLLPPPPGIEAAVALFAYVGVGREMITRLKYANHRDGLPRLSRALAVAVVRAGMGPQQVTWVPTTPQRRRERGFDQAELLARAVSHHLVALGIEAPCHRSLRRLDRGHQTGRDIVGRHAASFEPVASMPDRMLVVDDVRTTGSSLSASASALRRGGALQVWAATLAATPRALPEGAYPAGDGASTITPSDAPAG